MTNDFVLLDVTPLTLGIEIEDGIFAAVIERNSTIPARKSRVFTTVADYQTCVEVHILQGESDRAAYNQSLARFQLAGIPPAPEGETQIEVALEIDVNRNLLVRMKDLTAGRASHLTIRPSEGPSHQQGLRLFDGVGRAVPDRGHEDPGPWVRQLDGLVANTRRIVPDIEDKLSAEERHRILAAVERAEVAKGHGALHELRTAVVDMEKAATLIGLALLRP